MDPTAGPLTAVIVDDHPAIIAGVTAWCSAAQPSITVIDADGRSSRVWTGTEHRPMLSFSISISARRTPAFQALRKLVDAGRRIVVYSQRPDTPTAMSCLEIGALTYLTKTEGKEHLIPAIRACAAEMPYTMPSMAGAIVAGDNRSNRPILSDREWEVMLAWFTAASKRMVPMKLGLSVKSVETDLDRARIRYANVGRPAPTKTALLRRAVQDGLTGIDSKM